MEFINFLLENWQPLTAIFGLLLSFVGTLGMAGTPPISGRQKLKLDLEIYKLMKESIEEWSHQRAVKREIDVISKKIFLEDDGFRHAYHTTIGLVLTFGFGWWTYEILWNDQTEKFELSWWAPLTVYWCLIGVFIVAAGLHPPLRRKLWFVHTPLGAAPPDSSQQA